MAKKTVDQMAKEFGNKDYHSEKLLSGDPKKGDYNYAVSGKKDGERYSRSIIKSKKGKKVQGTTTSSKATQSPDEKTSSVTSSYKESNKIKGGHHMKGKTTTKNKRKKSKTGLLEMQGY